MSENPEAGRGVGRLPRRRPQPQVAAGPALSPHRRGGWKAQDGHAAAPLGQQNATKNIIISSPAHVRGKHNFYSGKLDVYFLKIVKHYKKRETTENGADPTSPGSGSEATGGVAPRAPQGAALRHILS